MMAARAINKKYLKTVSSPERLVQIQNNFTEMLFLLPSAKFTLMGIATRALDKTFIKLIPPHELLVKIKNVFTEIFLIMTFAIFPIVSLHLFNRLP